MDLSRKTHSIICECRYLAKQSTHCSATLIVVFILLLTRFVWNDTVKLARGPYLQQNTPSSVIVKFRTNIPVKAKLVYGGNPGSWSDTLESGKLQKEFSFKAAGLSANTIYYYAILNDKTLISPADSAYYFKTSPIAGRATDTRIWWIGDSGTGNKSARNVRDAYLKFRQKAMTDLMIMLGDNAYSTGKDSEYQRAVFNMYKPLLVNTPLWSTYGNHDKASAEAERQTGPYFDIFSFPKNGEAGGVPSGTEAYFSHDYANIHFVNLNSNSISSRMVSWLKEDLKNQTQDWLIAYWHHPPYTKGSHNSDTESQLINMRRKILPLLETHGVDMVFCGHSHSYERSHFISNHYGLSSEFDSYSHKFTAEQGDGDVIKGQVYRKTSGQKKGCIYIVAGNGGKTSGGKLNHPAMVVSLNELGSVEMTVNGNRADVTLINDKGKIRDRFRILKGESIQTRPDKLTFYGLEKSAAQSEKVITVESANDVKTDQLTIKNCPPWLLIKKIIKNRQLKLVHSIIPHKAPARSTEVNISIGGKNIIQHLYTIRYLKDNGISFQEDSYRKKFSHWNVIFSKSGDLWIENTRPGSYQFMLLTPDGRLVKQSRNVNQELRLIDVPGIKSGIYLLHLKSQYSRLTKWIMVPDL